MELELHLSEKTIAQYANLAVITHTGSEFVLDFAAMMPGLPKPHVVSRIVMTPDHAKRLLAALADNVGMYEEQFGEIKAPGEGEL